MTDHLGARESQVLHLIAEGLSNKEIGARLGVSEFTIKSHVQHVFRKLGATNRPHAVAIGVRRGWLDLTVVDHWVTWGGAA
jgi:DNA-binding CsgD family transcriptional regulator